MNIPRNDKNGEKARLFFALWPCDELRGAIYSEAVACHAQHGGRVMRRETLHMTLLFLGDVMRSKIPELVSRIDEEQYGGFEFCLNQLQCWRHNRIAYVTPGGAVEALSSLVCRLREAAVAAHITFDQRAFTPHVTLIRKLDKPFVAKEVNLPSWQVHGFSLVESVLQTDGSMYRDLYAWHVSDR